MGWALQRAREVLAEAPPGAWPDTDDDDDEDEAEAQSEDGHGAGKVSARAAWFAPQQRSKCAAPPGYIEA